MVMAGLALLLTCGGAIAGEALRRRSGKSAPPCRCARSRQPEILVRILRQLQFDVTNRYVLGSSDVPRPRPQAGDVIQLGVVDIEDNDT